MLLMLPIIAIGFFDWKFYDIFIMVTPKCSSRKKNLINGIALKSISLFILFIFQVLALHLCDDSWLVLRQLIRCSSIRCCVTVVVVQLHARHSYKSSLHELRHVTTHDWPIITKLTMYNLGLPERSGIQAFWFIRRQTLRIIIKSM